MAAVLAPLSACSDTAPTLQPKGAQAVNTITSKDGTQIYYKDWGSGPVVTFSHGWPLNADAWDGQMCFLAERGFRVVAHDLSVANFASGSDG
jgi:non-heme chloroperoxidase